MDAGIVSGMGRVGRRDSNYRQLQRFTVEEQQTNGLSTVVGGSNVGVTQIVATSSGVPAGAAVSGGLREPLKEEGEPMDTEPSVPQLDASLIPSTALTCLLFSLDVAMNAFTALPQLGLAGAWTDFWWLLLCITAVPALSAAVTTTEMGVWDKVHLYPLDVRRLFMAGMFGFFVITPLGFLCATRAAWVRRDLRFPHTCVEARSWLTRTGALMLVMALLVKAGAAVAFNLDLSPSLLVGFFVLVKVAAEYDTQEWVYFSLRYTQGQPVDRKVEEVATMVRTVPLSSGSLSSLWSVGGFAVLLLRMVEIAASAASFAIFHAGTRMWLRVGQVSFGGFLLLVVRTSVHAVLFHMYHPISDGGLGGELRSVLACLFCPTSLLDRGTPALMHYVVLVVQLLLLALFLGLGGAPPGISGDTFEAVGLTVLAAVGILPLAIVVRGACGSFASSNPERARLFAEEVKAGATPDLPIEDKIARHPHFQYFARHFCGAYFGPALQLSGGNAKLDFQNSGLDIPKACTALGIAAPILRNARSLELSCEGTDANDRDVGALLKYLPHLVNTLEVNLAGTHVGDESLAALAAVLPARLRSLEVGFNSTAVTDEGLAAFARRLPRGLLALEAIFYNTHIGDQGVVALARSLPKGLTHFRAGLYKTEVGDLGVQALVHYLPETVTTFKADLSGTKVTDLGANALAQVVVDLDQLQNFQANVSGTQVSEEMKQKLKDAARATAAAPTFKARRRAAVEEAAYGNVTAGSPEAGRGYCCSVFPFCTRGPQDLDSVL